LEKSLIQQTGIEEIDQHLDKWDSLKNWVKIRYM